MSTEDNIRKSTENLDEAAGGAPSDEFLDKVDPADFGTTDESEDGEGDETGDSTAEGDEDSDDSDDASDGPESEDEESRG